MIHIKRLLFILILAISGILLTFLYIDSSEDKPLEQIIQEEVQNKSLKEDVDIETKVEEEIEVAAINEDPVKDFISEKLKKAVSFFFKQEINVVTLGDSLTEGVGDETNNGGYVGILDSTINQNKHIVQFQNYAKRGSRSGQLLERLEDEEVRTSIEHADIVLITIGANDIMQVFKDNFTKLTIDKFTSEQIRYEQRLEAIFSEINALNEECDIYLIGFYNPFKQYFADIEELDYIVQSWNEIGESITEQYDNTHFIPMKDLFDSTEINYLAEDNFHPNYLGYKMMAERILQYVMNEGDVNESTEQPAES